PGQPPAPEHQMTPEERQIAAAYARELEARSSPLTSRGGSGAASPFVGHSAPGGPLPSADAQAIVQALANRPREGARSEFVNPALKGSKSEYDTQNAQTVKTTFLAAAREKRTDDYLQSTRTQPLSPYEIKAGWEIPAVLEQGLNSDLPGELKALVSSNIF